MDLPEEESSRRLAVSARQYDGDRRWLQRIGGVMLVAKKTPRVAVVIVRVEPALGGEVTKQVEFDASLAGYVGEVAMRRAFVEACAALRAALA